VLADTPLAEGYDYYTMFHGVHERVPVPALAASARIIDRFLMNSAI
jgi:acetylornithine deacetylase/succinyl-diaminopimelate desuccinylase-like protein